MPDLTINIPASKTQEVADAVAATYGVDATAAGLRKHLIDHLKQTHAQHTKSAAAQNTVVDQSDPADWGDLAD